jgi:hypothetical protein
VLAVLGLGTCENKEPSTPTPPTGFDAGSVDDDLGLVPIPDDFGFVPLAADDWKSAQAGTPSSSPGLSKPGRFKALVAPGGADGYPNFLWVVDTATGSVKGYRFARESKGSWFVDQLDGPL